MKSNKYIHLIITVFFLFNLVSSSFGQEQEKPWTGPPTFDQMMNYDDPSIVLEDFAKWTEISRKNGPSLDEKQEKPWTGTLVSGQKINISDLKKILTDRLKWIKTKGKEGTVTYLELRGANLQGTSLRGANLQNADLTGTNLHGADLVGANLQEADLTDANLQGAKLLRANLQGADLLRANLHGSFLADANIQKASLTDANLQEAYLRGANIQKASLTRSNLKEADLTGASLQEAYLRGANLQGCIFEIKQKSLPVIQDIAETLNLSQLKYKRSPQALVELRKVFKESGLRKQEREITYAIKRSGFEKALPYINYKGHIIVDYYKLVEAYLGWFFFELTCDWGMAPARPLRILFVLLTLFTIPYTVSITRRNKKDGIWKIWIPERVRTDLGGKRPELIRLRGFKALKASLYFSVLSAFNIGWRDLNVGGWISKIQPQEYRLQATGWVRSVSGLQSIISVYLLALTVLTYFGRPFESY